MGVCVEGGEALFIALEVGSPPTHIWKVIRCLGSYSSSRCTWTGGRAGSAEPRVRPTPPLAPLVLILFWQADRWALVSFLVCIMCGAPICSIRWALFVSG